MKLRSLILGVMVGVLLFWAVSLIVSYVSLEGDYGIRTKGTEPLSGGNIVILRLGKHGMGYVFMRYGDIKPLPLRYGRRDNGTIWVHPLITQDSESWWPWLRRGDCCFDFRRDPFGLHLSEIHPADARGAIPRDDKDNGIEYLGKRLFTWSP
jgi:hypothetical protein